MLDENANEPRQVDGGGEIKWGQPWGWGDRVRVLVVGSGILRRHGLHAGLPPSSALALDMSSLSFGDRFALQLARSSGGSSGGVVVEWWRSGDVLTDVRGGVFRLV